MWVRDKSYRKYKVKHTITANSASFIIYHRQHQARCTPGVRLAPRKYYRIYFTRRQQ